MYYTLIDSDIPIKSCPFCGEVPKGIDRWLVNDTEKVYHYSVSCDKCRRDKIIAVNTFSYLDPITPVKVWNDRK